MGSNSVAKACLLLLATFASTALAIPGNGYSMDLGRELDSAGSSEHEIAYQCQKNMLQGNYRGSELMRVAGRDVYVGKLCSTGQSGGVSQWIREAALDEVRSIQCADFTRTMGNAYFQWTIKDGRLISIRKDVNCATEFGVQNGIRIIDTAYPIRWRCEDYARVGGYNPQGLAKYCQENRIY